MKIKPHTAPANSLLYKSYWSFVTYSSYFPVPLLSPAQLFSCSTLAPLRRRPRYFAKIKRLPLATQKDGNLRKSWQSFVFDPKTKGAQMLTI